MRLPKTHSHRNWSQHRKEEVERTEELSKAPDVAKRKSGSKWRMKNRGRHEHSVADPRQAHVLVTQSTTRSGRTQRSPGHLPRYPPTELEGVAAKQAIQQFDLGSEGTASRPGARGHIKAADEHCLRVQTKEIKQEARPRSLHITKLN